MCLTLYISIQQYTYMLLPICELLELVTLIMLCWPPVHKRMSLLCPHPDP